MIAVELIERHLVFPKLVMRESVFEIPAEQFLIQLVLFRKPGRIDCVEALQEAAPLVSGGAAACNRKVAQFVVVAPFSEDGRDLGPPSEFCLPLFGDQVIQLPATDRSIVPEQVESERT